MPFAIRRAWPSGWPATPGGIPRLRRHAHPDRRPAGRRDHLRQDARSGARAGAPLHGGRGQRSGSRRGPAADGRGRHVFASSHGLDICPEGWAIEREEGAGFADPLERVTDTTREEVASVIDAEIQPTLSHGTGPRTPPEAPTGGRAPPGFCGARQPGCLPMVHLRHPGLQHHRYELVAADGANRRSRQCVVDSTD